MSEWFFVYGNSYSATLENETTKKRETKSHRDWWKSGVLTWHEYREIRHTLASGHFRDVFARWVRRRGVVTPWQVKSFYKAWEKKHHRNEGVWRYVSDFHGGAFWEVFEGCDEGGLPTPARFSSKDQKEPKTETEEILWISKQMKQSITKKGPL